MNNLDIKNIQNLILNKSIETKAQSGYSKKAVKYSEGDEWVENGKRWVLKNGVKTSLGKTISARSLMFCPSCSRVMKSELDFASHKRYDMCSNCYIKFETILAKKSPDLLNEYIAYKGIQEWIYDLDQRISYMKTLQENESKVEYVVASEAEVQSWSTNPEKITSTIKQLEEYKEKLLTELTKYEEKYNIAMEIWNGYRSSIIG